MRTLVIDLNSLITVYFDQGNIDFKFLSDAHSLLKKDLFDSIQSGKMQFKILAEKDDQPGFIKSIKCGDDNLECVGISEEILIQKIKHTTGLDFDVKNIISYERNEEGLAVSFTESDPKNVLFLSSEKELLDFFKAQGCQTVCCFGEGDIDEGMISFLEYVGDKLTVYIDLDDSLLNKMATLYAKKTLLNPIVVTFLNQVKVYAEETNIDCTFKFLTARYQTAAETDVNQLFTIASISVLLEKATGIKLLDNSNPEEDPIFYGRFMTTLVNNVPQKTKKSELISETDGDILFIEDDWKEIKSINRAMRDYPGKTISVLVVHRDGNFSEDCKKMILSFFSDAVFVDSDEKVAVVAKTPALFQSYQLTPPSDLKPHEEEELAKLLSQLKYN